MKQPDTCDIAIAEILMTNSIVRRTRNMYVLENGMTVLTRNGQLIRLEHPTNPLARLRTNKVVNK